MRWKNKRKNRQDEEGEGKRSQLKGREGRKREKKETEMWKRNKEEVRGGKLTYVEKHGRQKKRKRKGKKRH